MGNIEPVVGLFMLMFALSVQSGQLLTPALQFFLQSIPIFAHWLSHYSPLSDLLYILLHMVLILGLQVA